MKETRQSILQKAFLVFLEKGYHGTSITDIQNELEIGRATLYHHFTNKEDLFTSVINEVYMAMGEQVKAEDTEDMTISELIKHLEKKLYTEVNWLKNLEGKKIGMTSFFMLSFEALRMNPGYLEISEVSHGQTVKIWEKAIENSIARGEVKEDIDITSVAKLFIHVKHGIGVLSTIHDLEQSVKETREGYAAIYNLIKK